MRPFMPSRHSQAGSTLIWLVIWLAGMAAIAYWCVVRTVPALQQQIQQNAQIAVTGIAGEGIDVAVDGRNVTLSGTVGSDAIRNQLMSAANNADGVRLVNDQLTLVQTAVADQQTDTVVTIGTTVDGADNSDLASNTAATSSTAPTANTNAAQSESTQATKTEAKASDTSAQALPSAQVSPTETQTDEVAQNDTDQVAADNNETPQATDNTDTAESQSAQDSTPAPVNTEPKPVANSVEARAQALVEQAKAKQLPAIGNNTTPATNTPNSANQQPFLSMIVEDNNLNLTGTMSTQDDLLPFIESAMDVFDISYVVNRVELNDATDKAAWLASLNTFLPSMQSLGEAGIQLEKSQITLSGVASSEKAHNLVINDALTMLSGLSLVERISVSLEPTNEPVPGSEQAPAPAQTPEPVTAPSPDQPTEQATAPSPEQAPAPAPEPTTQLATASSPAQTPEQGPAPEQQPQPQTEQPATNLDSGLSTDSLAGSALSPGSLRRELDALETERILFKSGSDVLTEQSRRAMEKISELFAQYPDVEIGIDGHTDSSGNSSANLQLSQLRANAVRDYLIETGIDQSRLSAYGFGDGVPIADNATAAGRALNRRIEFNF